MRRLPHVVHFRSFHLFLTTAAASLSRHATVVESEGRSLISPEREKHNSRSLNSDRYLAPGSVPGKRERERKLEAGNNFEEFYNFKTLYFPHLDDRSLGH